MKAYIYFLSLLLTFAPVYANAILPSAVAFAGSTSGRVVLTKTGGAVLRTLSPTSIGAIAKNAVGICAKNPLSFAFCTTVISAIKGDGWDITINNNQTNNDIDVDIYMTIEDKCFIDYYLNEFSSSNTTNYDVSSFSTYLVNKANLNNPYKYNYTVNTSEPYSQISDIKETLRSQKITNTNYTKYSQIIRFPLKATASNGWTSTEYSGADFYYRCVAVFHNEYIADSALNNYFIKNVSDDDITNIYNYDYSQHNNIKINLKSDTGDNINNTVKNSDSENDKEMTETAAKKSKDKNPDYHPDKINDENCDKDDIGRYDKCGSDRDNDDDTASTPASTPSPTDPPKYDDDDDDEPPIECNSNGFYKKVCDWMDWTQEEPTKPTDEKPAIKDIEAQSSNKIDMAGSCPAPYQINFSVYGIPLNNSISYQPLCDALEMLKPIFVGAGALSSMFILMGYSRPNSTGVNN